MVERKVCTIFLVGTIITIILYFIFNNEKINYMVIGDSISYGLSYNDIRTTSYANYIRDELKINNNYNDEYSIKNLYAKDLYYMIVENKETEDNNLTIKQEISKADIITIHVGIDELHNNQNINLYLLYMENIVKEIKSINYKEIYIISLYSDNERINDVNKSLKNIASKYNIKYVDISNLSEEKYKLDNSYLLNEEGHKKIANIFINCYERNIDCK